MSIDPQEISNFQAVLSRTPADVIQKRLNDYAIVRSWKREMAEKEVARRAQSGNASQLSAKLSGARRHKGAVAMSWFVTLLLIACAVAIATGITLQMLGGSRLF